MRTTSGFIKRLLQSATAGALLVQGMQFTAAGHWMSKPEQRPQVSAACMPNWGYNQTCWTRFPPLPPCDTCLTCNSTDSIYAPHDLHGHSGIQAHELPINGGLHGYPYQNVMPSIQNDSRPISVYPQNASAESPFPQAPNPQLAPEAAAPQQQVFPQPNVPQQQAFPVPLATPPALPEPFVPNAAPQNLPPLPQLPTPLDPASFNQRTGAPRIPNGQTAVGGRPTSHAPSINRYSSGTPYQTPTSFASQQMSASGRYGTAAPAAQQPPSATRFASQQSSPGQTVQPMQRVPATSVVAPGGGRYGQ